jgi:phosphoglycerol transferase MdoB-like AlkP superfamily enzyme
MYVLLLVISFVQQLQSGIGLGILLAIAELLVCVLVFILSINNGKGGLTLLDKFCYLLLVLSLAIWAKTQNPFYGLVLISLSDLFATLPTISSIIKKPSDEVYWFWIAGSIGAVSALLAEPGFNFKSQIFIIYLAAINMVVALLVIVLKKLNKSISGTGNCG